MDGVWLNEKFYFDTGSRIGNYVSANPEVTIHLESAREVVIVEGRAERITGAADVATVLEAYNPKYHSDFTEPPGAMFVVIPRVAYGWINDPTALDEGAQFGSTGTRWDFA